MEVDDFDDAVEVDDVEILLLPLPFSFTVSQDLVDPERFLAVLLFFEDVAPAILLLSGMCCLVVL